MIYHENVTEPLAVEFANTRYATRGMEREGAGTPADLAAWLQRHGLPGSPVESDIPAFLHLRAAIRALLRATAEGEAPAAEDVATVNAASQASPMWQMLVSDGSGGYTVLERETGSALAAARSAIARSAVVVLGGPLRTDVRACEAPGCVLFFIKDHPRREWCSAGCGTRARAARHYTKRINRSPAVDEAADRA